MVCNVNFVWTFIALIVRLHNRTKQNETERTQQNNGFKTDVTYASFDSVQCELRVDVHSPHRASAATIVFFNRIRANFGEPKFVALVRASGKVE
jgi:hypothetical protein